MDALRPSHRLLLVTGKGGVGRSAVAAALAWRLAEAGDRTVLITQDTRDDRHPHLDVDLRFEPRVLPSGLAVSRVDASGAIREYARRRLVASRLYERFFESRAFRDFAAATPGFEELMTLGRLYDLATTGHYDRVVFDGPATGHFVQLVRAADAAVRAVEVGPLAHEARRIQDLLRDRDRTHVQPVTLAEEMPVREVLELRDACRELRMGFGAVVVNRMLPQRFSAPEVRVLEAIGARADAGAPVRRAVAVALREHRMADGQALALEPLEAAGLSLRPVPLVVQAERDPAVLIGRLGAALAPLLDGARAPAGAGGSGS